MKLSSKKLLSMLIFCIITIFIFISTLGVHSRWGDTINNTFKGFQNLRFSNDFDNYKELLFYPIDYSDEANIDSNYIVKSIKSRLTDLKLVNSNVFFNDENKQLIVQYSQPADGTCFSSKTLEQYVENKGILTIAMLDEQTIPKSKVLNLDEFKNREDVINNDYIEKAELVVKKDEQGLVEGEYGLRINLNETGTQILSNISAKAAELNNSSLKNTKKSKKQPKRHLLVCALDGAIIYADDCKEAITNGKIDIYQRWPVKTINYFVAMFNNKPLTIGFKQMNLTKSSPNLGMWFKRCLTFTFLIVLLFAVLILIIKFKLIGTICSVCLVAHASFILACFTGFFKIYPGVGFDFGAMIGCLTSGLIGIISCFLVVHKIQGYNKNKQNQFSVSVKNGLNDSFSFIIPINLKLTLFSLVLMVLFSHRTNVMASIFYPMFNVCDFDITNNIPIASLAYAMFVGSLGGLIFEVLALKLIASPLTSSNFVDNLSDLKNLTQLFKSNKPNQKDKQPAVKNQTSNNSKAEESKIDE